jgi:hypothetical protein
VAEKDATFTFALNRDKLRKTRRREGRWLLRTNLCDEDPAKLWKFYIQLVEIEIDQSWWLSRFWAGQSGWVQRQSGWRLVSWRWGGWPLWLSRTSPVWSGDCHSVWRRGASAGRDCGYSVT